MKYRNEDRLTPAEGFAAMRLYLMDHETHGDTVSALLADVALDANGIPLDSATWIDWLRCIRRIRGEDSSEESILLAEVMGNGPLAPEGANWLARKRVSGADGAILTALRATHASDARRVVAYVRALHSLGVPLPSDEAARLSKSESADVRVALSQDA